MIRSGTIQKWNIPGTFPDLTNKIIRKKLAHVWGYYVRYDGTTLTYTGTSKELDAFVAACKKLVEVK